MMENKPLQTASKNLSDTLLGLSGAAEEASKKAQELEKALFSPTAVFYRKTIPISFDIDFRFWAITPAFNLNFHSKTFEIEWLCFAIYVDFNVKVR